MNMHCGTELKNSLDSFISIGLVIGLRNHEIRDHLQSEVMQFVEKSTSE